MLWDKQEGRSGVKVMGGWVVERHPWLRACIIIIIIIVILTSPHYHLKCTVYKHRKGRGKDTVSLYVCCFMHGDG